MKKIGDGSPQVNLQFKIRALINKVLYSAQEDDIQTEAILQGLAGSSKPVFDRAFYKGRKEGAVSDLDVLRIVFSFIDNISSADNSFDICHSIYKLSMLKLWNPHQDEKNDVAHGGSLYSKLLEEIIDSPDIKLNKSHLLELIKLIEDQDLAQKFIEDDNVSLDCKAELLHAIEKNGCVGSFEYYEMLSKAYKFAVDKSDDETQSKIIEMVRRAKDYECKKEDKREEERLFSKDEYYGQLVSYIASKVPSEKRELRDDLILSLKGELLIHFRQIIEKSYERYNLSPEDRIDLINRHGDEEYIRKLIHGEIELDEELKKSLREVITKSQPDDWDSRKAYYLKYAKDEKCLTDSDRLCFMIWSDSKEEMRKFLETHKYNSFDIIVGLRYLPICLRKIGDYEFSQRYINDLPNPAKLYLTNAYVNECKLNDKSPEAKKMIDEWESRLVCISNISKLKLEDAQNLPDNAIIKVFDNGDKLYQLYSKETYCKILEKINERYGSIPEVVSGDKNSEVNTLLDVCMGMSGITFDYYAGSEESDNDWNAQIKARNLEGPILEGKCVCAGFANALKNIYILKGGIATFVSGTRQGYVIGHAWNQVKIGDCWFNVDVTSRISGITWLAELGERIGVDILESDEAFEIYKENDEFLEDKRHNCNTDIAKLLGRDSDKKVDKNPYDEIN